MKLTDTITCLFEDAAQGKREAALMHACNGIDATGKKLYPGELSVGKRFVRCVRDYYWLVEPMMGVGFALEEITFDHLTLPKLKTPPDFADVVYSIHRNSHAHGDEVPVNYEMIETHSPFLTEWEIGEDVLRIPDRIIWALAAIVVFSRVNDKHLGWGHTLHLTWGVERYFIREWWGRERDIRPIAQGWNTLRVKLTGLEQLRGARARGATEVGHLTTVAPPPARKSGD